MESGDGVVGEEWFVASGEGHCEQWFEMARYRVARRMPGETVATIAKDLHVPQDVVTEAMKRPLQFGTPEFTEASKWYSGIYGAGRAAREKTLTELKTWTAALDADKAAVAQLKAASAPASQITAAEAKLAATDASYQTAYQAYRALPEEIDAWKVGEDAAAAYRAAAAK